MRSCAHWLSINIDVDVDTGGEMVRAGHALDELPALRAAFAEGRISFDKIRAVTKVATPDDDEMWLLVALHALAASSPASAAAFGAHSKPTIRAAAAVPT